MLYRIHLTAGSGLPVSETRQREDAARLLAERIAYNCISSNGGLDTQQGHAIMSAVRALDFSRGGTITMYGRVLFVTPSRS